MHWLNSNKPSNPYIQEPHDSQCLKITKKVVINIASEASYVNILSGQKFIENAKNGQFGEVLKIEATSVNSVTRQVTFNKTKIGRKCQNLKISNATF